MPSVHSQDADLHWIDQSTPGQVSGCGPTCLSYTEISRTKEMDSIRVSLHQVLNNSTVLS